MASVQLKVFVASAETPDPRAASHAYLEEVLAGGEHPSAECRVNYTTNEYSVWSGPQGSPVPDTTRDMLATLDMEALAALVATKLKGTL